MISSTPQALDDMPFPQAAAYYFRLQHMQNLLGRHRAWRTFLRLGVLASLSGATYGLVLGGLAPALLALLSASVSTILLVTLPKRLQCQYQRDIATLLRDLPPARDSQPPSLCEISRLLQAPLAFERVLADWLQQEISRCRQTPSLQTHQR